MQSDFVSVVEVGTSRTTLLAGRMSPEGGIEVLSFAEQETTGMRKGRVVEPQYVARAIRTVCEEAEAALPRGGRIASTAIVCAAGDVACEPAAVEVPVTNGDGRVGQDDVDRVRSALDDFFDIPQGREMFGEPIPLFYTLDSRNSEIREPLDMAASSLKLHGMAITTDSASFDALDRAVEDAGLECNYEIFSGLAAAAGCMPLQKMEDGALCICLGGGTTTWCAYRRRHPIAAGALPIGGDHVTNDLMSAFMPGSRILAERLKIECGRADPQSVDPASRVAMPRETGGAERTVSEQAVAQVIHARLDETLRLVRADLEARGVLPWLGGGIILAGGGALVPGVAGLVSKIFGSPCTTAKIESGVEEIDSHPERNATIWGALGKALRYQLRREAMAANGGVRGFFKKIFSREGGAQ